MTEGAYTSSKLRERTYPALQELLDRVVEVMSEKGYGQLPDTSIYSQPTISHQDRRDLLQKQANVIADVLNELHRLLEPTESIWDPLSPEARGVLYSIVGSAPYFASIFLPFFYDKPLLLKFADSKSSIDRIYNDFVHHVESNANQYLYLAESRKQIAKGKKTFHNMGRSIM